MVGGWSCVIRFACHIPMGMIGFGGRGIYNTVKGLADDGLYDVLPHGHAFLEGLKMYSTWVSRPAQRHTTEDTSKE